MKKKLCFVTVALVLMSFITSCTQVDIFMPKGPKGDNGLSAYEVWKDAVNDGSIDWSKDETALPDYFRYLKGKDGAKGDKGDKGDSGTAGKSAYEVWKEFIASGEVEDPHNPGQKWDKNKNTVQDFWIFLTGKNGENGKIPYIGSNGNWWIGDVDTKVPARGEKGDTGTNGTSPHIGENGNWWIGDVDTNVPARGSKGDKGDKGDSGDNGENGKSAYELWKEEIAKGTTPNPHNPSEMWDPTKNTIADFWEYLRGRDGKNTSELISDYILTFIIIQKEADGVGYDVKTGDAIIKVADRDNNAVAAGSIVEFTPKFGLAASKTYTVAANGTIRIPRADLLANGTPFDKRSARANIKVAGIADKVFQTNIFTYPTQIAKGEDKWYVWNDWGPGVIRAKATTEYTVDAAGSTAVVEVDNRPKVFTYTAVSLEWYGAKSEEQLVRFDRTDMDGNVIDTNSPRVADMWYARQENTPVARRTLYRFDSNDKQRVGWEFNTEGREFSNDPYYVRTKSIPHFFGVGGNLQSPIIKVTPMPRLPLITSIKFSGGKAVGQIAPLEETYKQTKVGEYILSNGIYVPQLEIFEDTWQVHILLTKGSISNVGSTTLGSRTFEIPAAMEQLEGMKVWLSSPFNFSAPGTGTEASIVNQQPHFRPLYMGVIENVNGEFKLRISSDLVGNNTTYVPLHN